MSTTTMYREYVDRDSQRTDTLYVMPDETCWFTPDGVGRIFLFEDDEQTIPMTEAAAIGEVDPEAVVHVDHTCEYEQCDRRTGDYCRG